MINLIEQATGYFTLDDDIPDQGFLAGDQVYIDSDPQTTARLVIGVWDDMTHICQRAPSGTLWDCCHECVAPDHAVVYGRVLYYSRTIPSYKEATV